MEKVSIKADVREVGKKGVNRRLRNEGRIPAVLYGRGEEPLGLTVHGKEFTTMIRGSGVNVLINLELSQKGRAAPVVVMVKDYQIDAITRKITHLDLLKIDLKEKVTVKIPIHLTGKSVGVVQGGLIEQSRRELEVKCLPDRIPEAISIDITNLEIGNSIHVNELKLPEGVEAPHDVNFTIVSIVLPREEEVAAPAEAAAVAAAPAGAEGAPAGEAAPSTAPATAKGEKK